MVKIAYQTQADYKKLMENSIQRAAAIDTSILFVRKQHNEHETNVNNIESAFSNSNNINDNTSDEINDETKAVHLSDLYTISSDNNVSNINEEVRSDITYFQEEENAKNVPSYQKIHEIAKDDHDTDIDFQNVVLINDEKDTFKDVVVDKQTQQDQVVEISGIMILIYEGNAHKPITSYCNS